MKRCIKCGCMFDESENVCPACGHNQADGGNKAISDGYVAADASVPSLGKYADFMTDEMLLRTAMCKRNGVGVTPDRDEALRLFKVLALRGNCDGMYRLAEMLLEANPPDRDGAVRWLRTAAGGGHLPSKIKLNELGEKVGRIFSSPEEAGPSLEARVRNVMPHILAISCYYTKFGDKYMSRGSGFILDDGYIVTNAHVVGTKPEKLYAQFEPGIDKTEYEVRALAIEEDYDVAILKFKGAADRKFSAGKHLDLQVERMEYGEDVFTIGNPLGIGISVSHGVVSCPNRESDYPKRVKEVIQTDITANHGNSGGPLLSSQDKVAGMLTFSPGEAEGGMSMCVPSKYILKVLNKV